MSEVRLWFHRKIARLDGVRERRFVALASALIFASLALGPQALRVVDAQVNAPDIRIDEFGSNPISNPVRFKATALNFEPQQLGFMVTMPDGSFMPIPGHRIVTSDPSRWESADFQGVPGQSYSVKARSPSSTGSVVESSQAVTFSIFDPNQGGSAPPPPPPDSGADNSAPKVVEILQAVAWPGTEPKVEAKGHTSGFFADSAFFRAQSITGLAFLGEYPAGRAEGDVWNALFPLPGGAVYKVTLVARDAGAPRESTPVEVSVPVAETPPPSSPPQNQPPPPAVALLLPNANAELASPTPFAARVTNATATSVIFEVLDPAGVTRTIPAGFGTAGEWTAIFTGAAGQYGVRARVMLTSGAAIPPTEFRSFRILPSATDPNTPPPEPPPPTPPTDEPVVELFSPPADAPPFTGTVPLTARVRNGLPEKVAAVVTGPTGAETIVLATKTPTGDFWNAIFEGPDGEYRFRMRALVGGKDVFSPERRFIVKRPAAPPPPTTNVPPPAPAPQPAPAPTAPTTTAPPPTNAPTGTVPPQETVTAPTPAPQLPDAMAAECRAAGIPVERCAEWIKAKYQSRECLDAGAVTRESCAALLTRLNMPSDESKLIGLIGRQEIVQAREDAQKLGSAPVRRDELPASLAALLPPAQDQTAHVRVMAVANANEDSSPALLVIDTDGDGLPDDVERRFGSDPRATDTDGDGFDDGTEVKNGYDPAGPGTLKTPARGVEKALIEGRPIEEPRGAESLADPSFRIAAKGSTPETGEEEAIRLSGTAAPNSVVTIFIYSYLPIVVTTTTDANGNWTYDFDSKLAEGRHEAYVSVNDDTGKLVAASNPIAFFVKEAQAVSEEDFLRPDVNVTEAPTTFSRWFVYGGIALIALALILVIAIIRQVRKNPMTGSGEGL